MTLLTVSHSIQFQHGEGIVVCNECACLVACLAHPCAHSCPAVAQYEPELFPGLIYRMLQPKVVLLIFVSGKVVLTGVGGA